MTYVLPIVKTGNPTIEKVAGAKLYLGCLATLIILPSLVCKNWHCVILGPIMFSLDKCGNPPA